MKFFRTAGAVVTAAVLLVCVPGSASAQPAGIRVLNYNIHTGIGADGRLDLARTARAILDTGADVVGLEEVDQHWAARSGYADQAAELAALTGMHVFFAPIYDLPAEQGRPDRRRYGVAVLSRFPFLRTENHQLTRLSTVDPNPVPAPAPGFAEAEVRVHGERLHIYVTHLDYRPDPAIRRIQAGETVRVLDHDGARAKQVLLGDFNAPPAAPELAPLLRRVRDAGPPDATYPAVAPTAKIDFVTTSGGFRVRDAEVPVTRASDHRPVLAALAFC
ncbi:endonuclease/exonuclease/phosphatase family protein [Amycolatopsis minnesotensis]|uniref:Endonuclease/exonuclease/phosphatase family protein n=1 Tax=Amycolatopsis minnesotensis TaxID=337894 RepID=A0ABN2Q5A8_9PSEU